MLRSEDRIEFNPPPPEIVQRDGVPHSIRYLGTTYPIAMLTAVFVEAAKLRRQLAERDELIANLREALSGVANDYRDIADDMGCDASNPDGGSYASCEHCQLRSAAAHLESL